jgi:ABC-2 type transport system ATP-binding protein
MVDYTQREVTIEARGLVKRYKAATGPIDAVHGIDLAVHRGETFGLIGPDGAGKTTTLRVILGLLRRTGGQSHILGYDSMRDTFEIRERVGYIAQQFALPPDMTVMENMRFFADVQGVTRRVQRERIDDLLAFAGLTAFGGRLAGRLSGGMKKKLALACSLVHEPQVLLLDEPTLGVDPVSRREFWNLLGRLRAEQGVTILVCTPYMDEAERCTRVGLIYEGQLVAVDTPPAIKRLLPGELLEVGVDDLPGARRAAAEIEGVIEVQTYGRALHLIVDDATAREAAVVEALRGAGVAVHGARQIESRMEEAFISLIRRQQGLPQSKSQE